MERISNWSPSIRSAYQTGLHQSEAHMKLVLYQSGAHIKLVLYQSGAHIKLVLHESGVQITGAANWFSINLERTSKLM